METETGALSVEDALARMSEIEEAVEETPQPEPEAEEPEEAHQEAEEEGEAEPEPEEGEAQPEPIQPPQSWAADAKEEFAKLPRDLQEYIVQRETERDRGISTQIQQAAEARKKAEAEANQLAQLKPAIDQVLNRASEQFKSRWDGMDATAWQQLAQQDPNRYIALKAAYDADVSAQQQLTAAQQQAEAAEWQAFSQAQTARLQELAPTMVGDQAAQQEVFSYIQKVASIPAEQLRWVTAEQFLIAQKAMLYDRAQAPQPKPQGKKVATVKPSTPPVPQKQRQASETAKRFESKPSLENALALMAAKGF
jgi:hypothetical protein